MRRRAERFAAGEYKTCQGRQVLLHFVDLGLEAFNRFSQRGPGASIHGNRAAYFCAHRQKISLQSLKSPIQPSPRWGGQTGLTDPGTQFADRAVELIERTTGRNARTVLARTAEGGNIRHSAVAVAGVDFRRSATGDGRIYSLICLRLCHRSLSPSVSDTSLVLHCVIYTRRRYSGTRRNAPIVHFGFWIEEPVLVVVLAFVVFQSQNPVFSEARFQANPKPGTANRYP